MAPSTVFERFRARKVVTTYVRQETILTFMLSDSVCALLR